MCCTGLLHHILNCFYPQPTTQQQSMKDSIPTGQHLFCVLSTAQIAVLSVWIVLHEGQVVHVHGHAYKKCA